MSEVRQRKSKASSAGAAAETPSAAKTVTIDTSAGHLGVTLADGKLFGVQIEDLDSADLVFKAGLKVGDVIKSVNGTSVSTHAAALKIFDDSKGTAVTVEYVLAAEIEKQIADKRKARNAFICGIISKIAKAIVALLLLTLGGVAFGYKFLDQDLVQDPVDMYVLPKLGFAQPEMGIDMRPLRRVVPPKDPSKPWTVPGWDRKKDEAAMAKVKKSFFWNMRAEFDAKKEETEPENTKFIKELMVQIRSSGGKLLDHLDKMEADMKAEMEMFEQMAAAQNGQL